MVFTAAAVACAQSNTPPGTVTQLNGLLKCVSHDDSALALLAKDADALVDLANQREKETKAEQKRIRQTLGLSNLTELQLHDYFQGRTNDLAKKDIRGVVALAEFAHGAVDAKSPEERAAYIWDLDEVMAALRNNYRAPLPEKLGVLYGLKFFTPEWRRNAGAGTKPATNIVAETGANSGKNDPLPSTYWIRPTNLASANLFAGFGRAEQPSIADKMCTYDGPKTSYGTTPGIEVDCEGTRYKIKFAEFNSEPFTARIFYALGYHVDETDYVPHINIRYDRRMFREFNQHKSITIVMGGPFGIPIGRLQLQPHHDPFQCVVSAGFKDGHSISGSELKKVLLINPEGYEPEADPNNFRADVETTIDHLVMARANVQLKDTPTESIGPWDYEGLGHEDLREVRAAGLLAAWVGFCDTRWDNTRLRVEYSDGQPHLLHFFSDLGFGMGGADGFFSLHGEKPNDFAWTFTKPEIYRGPGQMTTPFRVERYRTIVPTRAFRDMTVDDARWMARLIAGLGEEQIRAALIASGYNAAEVKLYEEKLVSRRDEMVRDLKLTDEIPLLRPQGQARKFDFDPKQNGGVSVTLPSQETVSAEDGNEIIKGGQLVKRRVKSARQQ